jgi:hypothetical protein
MRYRIFRNNQFLGTILDRPAFHNRFKGKDPNNPEQGDIINFEEKDYTIKEYREYESESCTENEFHEKETAWFADIIVQ